MTLEVLKFMRKKEVLMLLLVFGIVIRRKYSIRIESFGELGIPAFWALI